MTRHEWLIDGVIEIEFKPDEPPGIPRDSAAGQRRSHEAAGVSPGGPNLDKQRQRPFVSLGAGLFKIVVDHSESGQLGCLSYRGGVDVPSEIVIERMSRCR